MKSALQIHIDSIIDDIRDVPGFCRDCGAAVEPGGVYRTAHDPTTGKRIQYRYYFCPNQRWWHAIFGGAHRIVPVREREE